jgi:SpoIVB peptidase S55
MRRILPLAATLAAALSAAPRSRADSTPEILPLSDVRPGMKGVGRTVFEGTRIEEFQVEVIGVLENVGPKQSIVLARLTGGPLANTGVIAGMSGSPVLIDGKLLGAVAYGFPFSKETIAGITPIGEMLALASPPAARPASARLRLPWNAAGGPMAPLDQATLIGALRRTRATPLSAPVGSALPAAQGGGQQMTPLALPLTFSGFDSGTFEWARELFGSLGFAPVMSGGAGSGAPREPLPAMAAGGAIGISLVEGDLDMSATGTVTYIDQGRVYAFGHPFYNLGPTQFPMRKAYVYSIFPSLYQSWKISVPAEEPVGTMDQDRTTAISGSLGRSPRMIPVEVELDSSRGPEKKTFNFRIVEDELFSPVLAFVSLASVLQGNERNFGTSSIHVNGTISLSGGREIRVDDLFAEEQPAQQAAALVAAPLSYLMSNDFERVTIEKLHVKVSSLETIQTAVLQRAWLERTGPVRPGTTVPLRVALRTYRGETRTETIPIAIPQSAPPGAYSVLVADGPALAGLEQREMRQRFVPKDLDQLVRAINGLRRNNHLYARLIRPDEGAIVGGEYLQALPPSVLSVLGGSSDSGAVVPIRTAAVWEYDLPTDYSVSGTRVLTLNVER